jgi:hypothetical protein
MWLLTAPPRKQLQDRYKFSLTDAWLDRAMKAAVRLNNGGSGGFVSPKGLVVTNHHVASDSIQKLSTKGKDFLRDGFFAKTLKQELKCPDLELNVLQQIVDVTEQVNAAVNPKMSDAEAAKARQAIVAKIEKESLEKTKLRSDVVTLYQGGAYHLYLYKKYTDVRLVFAPEQEIASFGGDVDNFEYPRFNLDVAFFRVYEDDKPAKTPYYFPWSKTGPVENDVALVIGHPGSTNRQDTLAMLEHRRDRLLPYSLTRLRYLEALFSQFGARGPEQHLAVSKDHHRVANARKAFTGQYQGLLDPNILQAKEKAEKSFRGKINADEKLKETVGDAFQRIAKAQKTLASIERSYYLLERGDCCDCQLFGIARHLLRLSVEKPKAGPERLREYGDARLSSLEFQLFSPAPISLELERVKLAAAFSFAAEQLGGENALVTKLLAGKSPSDRATQIIAGTKLLDVDERKRLYEGGADAVKQSKDTMIELARLIDDEARAIRKRYEEEVEEPTRQAFGKIAKARFAVLGTDVAPDATFTLRLAFGRVVGYEVEGETLPHATNFAGVFERSAKQKNRDPFTLPPRWVEGKDKLNLKTPFNFTATSDTIGGNSGSPVLNREGELVGVNFDRNRHGLVRNFVYTDVQARHISVHSAAVIEALTKLYDVPRLLEELK